jgi:RHS repeat-associated protein
MTDSDGRSVSYQYNAAGRLSRVSDSDAGDTLYHYDRLDRLVREINPRGMIEYAYNAADQLIERRINGTEITTYDHDPAGRVIRISHNGRDAVYDWDAAGRLVEKRLPNGMTQAYDHDPAGQMLRIRYLTDSGAEIDRIEYDYDLTGQISARRHGEGVPRDETPLEATYDADNRMLTYNGHALSYDDNGNLIRRETDSGPVIYTWDAHDRLIAIDGPHGSAAFRYDHLGRRIGKTVNGETVQYLYHGLQAVAELQGGAMGAVYHTGLMIDEVLARYTHAGDRVHLTDLLGSVMALTDDDGAIRTRYGYSAYGEMEQWGEGSDNPLQYTGRENDETGLYHYRARYYDPELKRFISRDPIGLLGGFNLYGYVLGDPINNIDMLGLNAFAVTWANNGGPRSGDGSVSIGIGATIGTTKIKSDTWAPGIQWGQTSQIGKGVGVELCFNRKPRAGDVCETTKGDALPDNVTVGLGRHLGVGFGLDGSFCINVGPSIGLPAGVGWDVR